jgi:hypothetical protein
VSFRPPFAAALASICIIINELQIAKGSRQAVPLRSLRLNRPAHVYEVAGRIA